MILRGINFGTICNASGARGFWGETTRFQWHSDLPEADWSGSTLVAKTATLHARVGNLPMGSDGITPLESQPACIVVAEDKQLALNSVGLSNPGIEALLAQGSWQKWPDPFFLSFMSVAATPEERLEELRGYVKILKPTLADFAAPVGLQINFSCPNAGLHLEELLGEVEEGLEIASELAIPLVPKFNLLLPVEKAREIASNPLCDALCISNTIPWGQLPEQIDWKALFGTDESPIARFGGGGLSGAPVLPLLLSWLEKVDLEKPIVAGGGILSVQDARAVFAAGAAAISLGTVSLVQPLEVHTILTASYE